MYEVTESEGDEPHRGGDDADAAGEDPALGGTCGHDSRPSWTSLLPWRSAWWLPRRPPGVDCFHPRRKYWPCPVPLERPWWGVVRSGRKVWGLGGAESHRNRERMRFNGRRRHHELRPSLALPAAGNGRTRLSGRAIGTRRDAHPGPWRSMLGPPPGGAWFVHVPVNHHGSCPRR